jgi:hypothetical protein
MATIKLKGSNKVKTEAAPSADNEFTVDGKKYRATKGAVVPLETGRFTMTAADICVSEEAQKYLIAAGASCIEPVIE